MRKFQEIFKKLTSSSKTKYVLGAVVICIIVTTLVSMRKTLTVEIDGKEQVFKTYRSTISAVLEDNDIQIGDKDSVSPAINTKLGAENKVSIHRAVNVVVNVDGESKQILSSEKTIADMFAAEGIELKDEDKVQPELDSELKSDLQVSVVRVNSELVKEDSEIDFETEITTDDELDKSVSKTVTEGQKGVKETTYKVVYEDGKQVSKTKVSEEVTKEPVNKVIKKGTATTVAVSRGESTTANTKYKKKLNMVATAYAIHGTTATGNPTVRDPNGISTIAVDPNVIPLGTKVYIPGYGMAIAHDTGSAIKSNKIDLFMNTNNEARNWGVRGVEVYIISYPGQ